MPLLQAPSTLRAYFYLALLNYIVTTWPCMLGLYQLPLTTLSIPSPHIVHFPLATLLNNLYVSYGVISLSSKTIRTGKEFWFFSYLHHTYDNVQDIGPTTAA